MQRKYYALALCTALWCLLPASSAAGPPAQKLPSALLVFPFIESLGASDTRIELVNLSGDAQQIQCFYLQGNSCTEVGFFLSLTPFQPISWLTSTGLNDPFTGSAAPPFFGVGELKCVVIPARPEVQFHNTIQGRATVFQLDGRTVSYGAVGFQRLTDGVFTGVVELNGTTYAQCPRRLHFDVLTDRPTVFSELILVPCTQDLLTQEPTTLVVQFQIVNEFEQSFSASISFTCFARLTLSAISGTLDRATLGTDTAHLILRGSGGALLGLVIDGVTFAGTTRTAGNEPSLDGGQSATVIFPLL